VLVGILAQVILVGFDVANIDAGDFGVVTAW
jgi:hypothetical protein